MRDEQCVCPCATVSSTAGLSQGVISVCAECARMSACMRVCVLLWLGDGVYSWRVRRDCTFLLLGGW